MDNTTTIWIIVAVCAVALGLIVALVAQRRARLRHAQLEQQFGPEYDRAVSELGSRARAEHELAARARRVEHFHLTELSASERARFAAAWSRVQAQFVDDPAVAVRNANLLINDVMRARGYPNEDFEQRVADLSALHPTVVQHYRAAHALSQSSSDGQINTEDLRQAVVHYRFLFADLLAEPNVMSGAVHAHA